MGDYSQLKKRVYDANMLLAKLGLVWQTFGNVSQIDREAGAVAIKPSGVSYDSLTPDDIVVLDLEGNILEGTLRPSSDTPTHLELYKAFEDIGSVAHTHSTFATAYAQSGMGLQCYGTTHADYFYGEIPCTRELTAQEIAHEYEKHTGLVIAEHFKLNGIQPLAVPAVLVKRHGPFAWGKDGNGAVLTSQILEKVAEMALYTRQLQPNVDSAPQELLDKHYLRKHGANAYYGQKGRK